MKSQTHNELFYDILIRIFMHGLYKELKFWKHVNFPLMQNE